MLKELRADLKKYAGPVKAKNSARFFKTGKGEYGEGDVFIGVTVPEQRTIAKEYKNLILKDIETLLNSKIHEERLVGLRILSERFGRVNEQEQEKIVSFYLDKCHRVNNWDLVDGSAPYILGHYILNNPFERHILVELANSDDIWKKRIAIVSTLFLIRKGKFDQTIEISKMLMEDKHDLIHKAVGWMLREMGKKDRNVLEKFLKYNYKKMPRTALRYSIEHFSLEVRKKYLNGEI